MLTRPENIPTEPGVYRFRDADGHVIYVGKAINLRARLQHYFSDPATLHPRTAAMLDIAHSVDVVTVGNEVEALTLEYSWIKENDPRFNVKYRDDKSYPYVALTIHDDFPRVYVTREHHRKNIAYFGPFAHAWAIRETIDQLQWVYPIRSCRDAVFKQAERAGRPCLLGYIGKCSAPCVAHIDRPAYAELVRGFVAFLRGDTEPFLRELRQRMDAAAAQEEFEEAAKLRDRIDALERALSRNLVAMSDSTDADVLAFADSPLEIGVQVFHIRQGVILGERSFMLEKDEDIDIAGYVDRMLQHLYLDGGHDIPREVLLPLLPASFEAWQSLLSTQRGSQVTIRVPQRGSKHQLMDLVEENARNALLRHQSSRAKDLTMRSAALRELQGDLGLPDAPLRIECIDISTMQGEHTVGALVVFEDGLARTSDYRNYVIREASDDARAIAEVVRRRFRPDQANQQIERSKYPPGLLVVDGGLPQVQAAAAALVECGRAEIPVIGLAKRLEEVWLPDGEVVILSRTSEGLYLLQRIRDEAHRRAIGFHRNRKSTSVRGSALDGVPGLGPDRAKRILAHFGSVRRVREAGIEQIQEVAGIGPTLAGRIVTHLRQEGEPT